MNTVGCGYGIRRPVAFSGRKPDLPVADQYSALYKFLDRVAGSIRLPDGQPGDNSSRVVTATLSSREGRLFIDGKPYTIKKSGPHRAGKQSYIKDYFIDYELVSDETAKKGLRTVPKVRVTYRYSSEDHDKYLKARNDESYKRYCTSNGVLAYYLNGKMMARSDFDEKRKNGIGHTSELYHRTNGRAVEVFDQLDALIFSAEKLDQASHDLPI